MLGEPQNNISLDKSLVDQIDDCFGAGAHAFGFAQLHEKITASFEHIDYSCPLLTHTSCRNQRGKVTSPRGRTSHSAAPFWSSLKTRSPPLSPTTPSMRQLRNGVHACRPARQQAHRGSPGMLDVVNRLGREQT
jgi:hypothetical protein